ncbi:MAG: hypothetical protein F3743_09405 [Nitrospinae bacterium]|nr:hypothetical protein [Nitrospinota bacterium]
MKTTPVILGSLLLFFTTVSPAPAKTAEQWYEQAFEQSLDSQYMKAIQSYRQALRLKKDWAKAHHGLAVMYFKLKDGVKAAHHLRMAKKFYPKDDKINRAIVQRNLEKTYATFDLDSNEFEDLENLRPAGKKESWVRNGNGFLFGEKGYLFTLLHNLGEEDEVRVRFANQSVYKAKVVKRYIVYDLALLKLDVDSPPPGLAFGDASVFRVQDPIRFIDAKNKVLTGKMEALRAIMNDKNIFELTLSGKSVEGMPLLNAQNQAVGIILSPPEITKNFQAAGMAPKGEIALKSSYLKRVFSLYISSLEGPRKRGKRSEKKEKKSGDLISSLAEIEIQK